MGLYLKSKLFDTEIIHQQNLGFKQCFLVNFERKKIKKNCLACKELILSLIETNEMTSFKKENGAFASKEQLCQLISMPSDTDPQHQVA